MLKITLAAVHHKGSVLSLHAWKRALAKGAERDAAEIAVDGVGAPVLDRRLLIGLAAMLR